MSVLRQILFSYCSQLRQFLKERFKCHFYLRTSQGFYFCLVVLHSDYCFLSQLQNRTSHSHLTIFRDAACLLLRYLDSRYGFTALRRRGSHLARKKEASWDQGGFKPTCSRRQIKETTYGAQREARLQFCRRFGYNSASVGNRSFAITLFFSAFVLC